MESINNDVFFSHLKSAAHVAKDNVKLRAALNAYLENPALDSAERRKFIEDEIAYTNGKSGKRTAEFILKILENSA